MAGFETYCTDEADTCNGYGHTRAQILACAGLDDSDSVCGAGATQQEKLDAIGHAEECPIQKCLKAAGCRGKVESAMRKQKRASKKPLTV